VPDAATPSEPSELQLRGPTFYPESLYAAKDGTLFVGSVGGLGIAKFSPGSVTAQTFVPPGSIRAVTGVYVDDANALLYACDVDPMATPTPVSAVRAFSLADASLKASYEFSSAAFCNDFTLDAAGNLFVTDSFGKIHVLRRGASKLDLWSSDPLLAPPDASGFGADGISFDGGTNLYVNTFTTGRLLRFPIMPDGSAGAPAAITVTPPLASLDGMRAIDSKTLIVVEGVGRLTRVAISDSTATSTTISNRLDSPTSVVRMKGSYWVTEGQLGHLLGLVAGPPSVPFLVKRIAVAE
jgi:sugar lactone lactonase YvrE